MRNAVIVDCVRTAAGKSPRGTLRAMRPDDMAAACVTELLKRCPSVPVDEIDDLIIGCAMPEAEQGMNMGRIVAMRAGLPDAVTGMTVNRFCSSGLQTIALAAERVRSGGAEAVLAGGAESMSLIPPAGHKMAPNPYLTEHLPEVYINMGLTAENVARKFEIAREDADAFSLASHQKAAAAQDANKFDDEIVPLDLEFTTVNGSGPQTKKLTFQVDEGVRRDTSIEALAGLRPVFHARGQVTAGNSSQTSDGAAMALVMSEDRAIELGLKPKARFLSFATGGVPPEIMGIGPVVAIPKALALAGLKLEDLGLFELNEAFAAQSLAVIRKAGLNSDIINVNGGAVALGHPLGCTGAKLTATILREMERREVRYGMVTMCVGGGQGAAGIFERIS